VLLVQGEVLLGEQLVFADPFVRPPWSALAPPGGSGLPRLMVDWWRYTVPAWEFAHSELTAGRLPLWNPYVFCGHDHAGAVQSAVFSPVRTLFGLLPPRLGLSLYVLFHTCLAAVGTTVFLRGRRTSGHGAGLGAVVFVLSGYVLGKMGQPTTLATLAWLPWMLWTLDRWCQTAAWRWIGLGALLASACLLSGHVQVFVICGLAVVVFLIGAELRGSRRRGSARRAWLQIGALGLLGLALVSPQLISVVRSTPITRGPGAGDPPPLKRPVPELAWSLLSPEPFGRPGAGTFDRDHVEAALDAGTEERAVWHAGGLLYPGALALVVLPLAIGGLRRHPYLPEGLALLASYVVVFVAPLHDAAARIPGLGLSPLDRLLILGSLGWGLVVAAGVDRLRAASRGRGALLLLVGLGLVAVLSAAFSFSTPTEALAAGALSRPLAAASVAAAVCGLILAVPAWRHLASALLVVMVVGELAPLARSYTPTADIDRLAPPTATTRFLALRTGHDRIGRFRSFALRPNAASTLGVRDVNGFAPIYSEHYRRLWSLLRPDDSGADTRWARALDDWHSLGSPLLRVVGVRFLLAPRPLEHPNWRPVSHREGVVIHRSVRRPLRARVVGGIRVADDDEEALEMLADPGLAPERETVLVGGPPAGWQPEAPTDTGRARIVAAGPRRVELSVETSARGILVLSDTFHRDWHATVDDREVEILRADVAFRAVAVPPGSSTVVFGFEPRWLLPSLLVSGLAAALALGLAGWPVRRRSRPSEPPRAPPSL
jgi:hypothetical protein